MKNESKFYADTRQLTLSTISSSAEDNDMEMIQRSTLITLAMHT